MKTKSSRSWLFALAMTTAATMALVPLAQAKPVKTKKPAFTLESSPVFPAMTETEYQSAKKDVSIRGKRKPAKLDQVDEASALSDDLKNIRSQVIGGSVYANGKVEEGKKVTGVKTAEELSALIDQLDAKFDSLKPDAQFLAAQIIALKPFKGFIYRSRSLFEQKDARGNFMRGKDPITHTAYIVGLRLAATGLNNFLPTEQWTAGFAFVTEPVEGMGKSISTESDFQTFLRSEWMPETGKLLVRLQGLEKKFTADKSIAPFIWDNKVLYGKANFIADGDRYLLVGLPEVRLAISGVFGLLSAMYGTAAYNLDGLFASSDEIAKMYGFRSMIDAGSMTSENRFKIIKKYNSFLTLHNGGEDWMKQSFVTLKQSIRYAELAWKQLEKTESDSDAQKNFLDPRFFAPFNRVLNTGFENLHTAIEGKAVQSAMVGGETVSVNLEKFFAEPPKDLKLFMPIGFEQGKEDLPKKIAGKTLTYRNYRKGMPNQWNMSAFQPYFPEVKSTEDIRRASRVLSQTWGGWLIGMPMSAILF